MIHLVEIEFVIGIHRNPTAYLSRAPSGLHEDIKCQDCDQYRNQNPDQQLSNKFHGLPSRQTHIKELCTIYAQSSRQEWCNSVSRQALRPAVMGISSFQAGRRGSEQLP
ncbi:hypothetical protein D3C76_937640 [compost metagenome]